MHGDGACAGNKCSLLLVLRANARKARLSRRLMRAHGAYVRGHFFHGSSLRKEKKDKQEASIEAFLFKEKGEEEGGGKGFLKPRNTYRIFHRRGGTKTLYLLL